MRGAAVAIARDASDSEAEAGAGSAPARNLWLAELVREDGPGILRMLWRLLGNEQDVMDAYQDCFCRLALRPDHGDVRSARAYAYRSASNIAIEMIRVRSRRAAHWPRIVRDRADGGSGESSLSPVRDEESDIAGRSDQQEASRLRVAIAALPAHLQHVIILRDLTGMSYEQVGERLGIEPTTARVYRRHAIVRLAELLNRGGATDGNRDQGNKRTSG